MASIKLSHKVVYATSEESSNPARELNVQSTESKGWLSGRFPDYPQELGFELVAGQNYGEIHLSQIQILSHQNKIPTKIEIFVGTGIDYDSATFKRLGFLSLDSNERSSFQARELKTVFVDQFGSFIKFRIQKNYINVHNPFNQVGIISVTFNGDVIMNPSMSTSLPSSSMQHIQNNIIAPSFVPQPQVQTPKPFGINISLDPTTLAKLNLLAEAKTRAVESEDYTTAKIIKSTESELRELIVSLSKLDEAKKAAVADEDYDLALQLKTQVDALRGEMSQKIMSIHLPNVDLNVPAHGLRPGLSQGAAYEEDRVLPTSNAAGKAARNRHAVDTTFSLSASHRDGARDEVEATSGGTQHYNSYDDRPVGRSPRAAAGAFVSVDHPEEGNEADVSTSYAHSGVGGTERDFEVDGESGQAISGENLNPFPPGEHPLEGVPGLDVNTLAQPEELSAKNRQLATQGGILGFLGEYCTQCLYSRNWILRDAAIGKTKLALTEQLEVGGPTVSAALTSCLGQVVAVCRAGLDDKNLQVIFSSFDLLDYITVTLDSCKAEIPRSTAAPIFEVLIQALIEKLSDNSQRQREAAKRALLSTSRLLSLGPGVVGSGLLRALSAKQKTAWRPLQSRLSLLTELVNHYGFNANSGLHPDSILSFMKSNSAFAHNSGEVRDAAKDLTIAIQRHVGVPLIEPYLEELRPKQKQEYMSLIEGSNHIQGHYSEVDSAPATHKKNLKSPADKAHPQRYGGYSSNSSPQVSPKAASTSKGGRPASRQATGNNAEKTTDRDRSGRKQSSGGGDGGSRGEAAAIRYKSYDTDNHSNKNNKGDFISSESKMTDSDFREETGVDADGAFDGGEFMCQFCSAGDETWTEDRLDAHYLNACPYLAPCPACSQILEIASLPDHLLDECKFKSNYAACDVTGLAIKVSEMAAWQRSPKCVSPPENCFYCPMCLDPVVDDNDPWRVHLLRECTQNLRTNT